MIKNLIDLLKGLGKSTPKTPIKGIKKPVGPVMVKGGKPIVKQPIDPFSPKKLDGANKFGASKEPIRTGGPTAIRPIVVKNRNRDSEDNEEIVRDNSENSSQENDSEIYTPDSITEVDTNIGKNLVPIVENKNISVPREGSLAKREASEEKIEEFLNSRVDVMTNENGRIKLTKEQRDFCVLFTNGILLFAKNHALNPKLLEARQIIRKSGVLLVEEHGVDLEVIRKIYENADRRSTSGRRGGKSSELQAMQTEFIRLVKKAADRGCSDIHVTVERHEAIIRVRADGVMEQIDQVKSDWASDLCAAAFNMADASDSSYRPLEYQGARVSDIRSPLPDGVQSVRLQFNPLPNGGRYMICRLLYSSSGAATGGDVDTLGYNKVHVDQIKKMRKKPYGINIICGPTGSGKSTTLQRALLALMKEKRNTVNLVTIEDPPEYVIKGAAQLPVLNAQTDTERNEKFRQAISASLRSDPDIVMIGEIRDEASCKLAFTAAMTGHQVWASLHANDAISIIDRFRDQKVELYKLADPTLVTGLIGQRLIRKLCPKCRIAINRAHTEGMINSELLETVTNVAGPEHIGGVFVANPKGCDKTLNPKCRLGYTGREVLAETILPDAGFMKFVREGDKESAVRYWLEKLEGLTMQEHAIQKMVSGLCDPMDVEDKAGDLTGFEEARREIVFVKLFFK